MTAPRRFARPRAPAAFPNPWARRALAPAPSTWWAALPVALVALPLAVLGLALAVVVGGFLGGMTWRSR